MPKTENKIKEDPGQDLMAANGGALFGKLLSKAVDKLDGEGAESVVAVIERLVDLKMKVDKQEAEKEFNRSLAEFQNECPQIKKTSCSKKGVTQAGGSFGYMYAPLDVVEKTIRPHLQPRGFSYYWDGKTTLEEGKFLREEICYLLHRNGHRTSSSISAPVTKDIGSMNEVQRFGTVGSYLKRYSLLAVLGIPTTDTDTDAASSVNPITEEQVAAINEAIKESVPPDAVPRFLKYLKVSKVEEISQANYEYALQLLARKKKEYESVK